MLYHFAEQQHGCTKTEFKEIAIAAFDRANCDISTITEPKLVDGASGKIWYSEAEGPSAE